MESNTSIRNDSKLSTYISYIKEYELVVLFIIFALIVIGIYYKSLYAPFIFDDIPKIVENSDIKDLENIGTKLVYPYNEEFRTFSRNDPSRPLTSLTYTLNYYFGKLDPFGYHILNILLHIFTVLALFFFIRKLLFFSMKKSSFFYPY